MVLQKIPDLNKKLEQVKIMIEIENAVKNSDSIFGIAIDLALRNNVPASEIIETIRSQSFDNIRLIKDVIGDELTEKILKIQDKK